MSEKFPTTPSVESTSQLPSKGQVIEVLKSSASSGIEKISIMRAWLIESEKRVERGEISYQKAQIEWLQILIEADRIREAVEIARDFVDAMGAPLGEHEDTQKGLAPDGQDLFDFCVEVIQKYGDFDG